jgi:hypothetical protein
MRIRTNVDEHIARVNNILQVYEMGQPIPVPEGKDIHITLPRGVFRCNINEGIFPEDRRFFQKSETQTEQDHIIRYSEIAHVKNPKISIKAHYPDEDGDVTVEFK